MGSTSFQIVVPSGNTSHYWVQKSLRDSKRQMAWEQHRVFSRSLRSRVLLGMCMGPSPQGAATTWDNWDQLIYSAMNINKPNCACAEPHMSKLQLLNGWLWTKGLAETASSVFSSALTSLICLTFLTFAHHSQLEIISFDRNSCQMRGNHYLWEKIISVGFDRNSFYLTDIFTLT